MSNTGLNVIQVPTMWSEKMLIKSAPSLSVEKEGTPVIRVANEPVSEEAPVVTAANEEVPPANKPTKEETPVITLTNEEAPVMAPTNEEAPVIAPTNKIPPQPSNESISEMLSEVSEDMDYDDDDKSVDFSNTNIPHVEGTTQFLIEPALEATPPLKPHPLTEPTAEEEVKLKPNKLTVATSLSKTHTPSKTTPGPNIEVPQTVSPEKATPTTSSPRVAKGQSALELRPLFEEYPIDSEDNNMSLATGHTYQPPPGYPLTVSQLQAAPGYTSLIPMERVGGIVPEL